jgi:hypothetical protein
MMSWTITSVNAPGYFNADVGLPVKLADHEWRLEPNGFSIRVEGI